MQDTENSAFRLVQHLSLRAHDGGGSGSGGEVLLAAATQIGGDAILLIILVYPEGGHYRRGLRRYPSRTEETESIQRRCVAGAATREGGNFAAGTKHWVEEKKTCSAAE